MMLEHRLGSDPKESASDDEEDDRLVQAAGLESFFPFDPYRLWHSSMFLFGIYRNWGEKESNGADILNEARPRGRVRAASCASQNLTSEDDDVSTDEDYFTDIPDVVDR